MTKPLRALTARIRRPRRTTNPSADTPRFNEPPIFPTDALLPPSVELAVPTDARPYSIATPSSCPRPTSGKVLHPSHPESPYHFADATLHIGDTTVPVKASAIDATWQLKPRKGDPERTVVGTDGDVIITGTIADDGTFTITELTDQQPQPSRRGGPSDGCPCTAIYSECRCPVLP